MNENETEIKNEPEKKEVEKKNFYERATRVVDSVWFRRVLLGVLGLLVLAIVFEAGIMIGYRRANFSYQWGENYHLIFGGPKEGFLPPPGAGGRVLIMRNDFINPHGLTGTVMKVDGQSIIVKGDDKVEKTIVVSDKTSIRSGNQDVKISDLKEGDMIVAIGDPNNSGQVEAKLVRVFKK